MKQSQKGRKRERGKRAKSYNTGKEIRWIWVIDEMAYRLAITG
jgi:hypothetical protein